MSTLELTALIGIVLGGLSLLVFTLAHAGLVAPVYMACAVALSLLCFFLILRRFLCLRSFQGGVCPSEGFLPPSEGRLSLVEWGVLCVLFVFVLLVLPFNLAPPIARDELIHHLTLPALYLREGTVVERPYMGFSYFPMNINMLYLAGLSFGSDVLPRLVHHGFGLLTALGIYSYMRWRVPRVYALLGALLFVATPVVINMSRTAYVDLGAAFFSTMALLALLQFRHSGKRWFFYSAVLLGFALGAKYNMLVVLFLLTPMAVVISIKKGETQLAAIKTGILYLVVALAVFSPWMIRNLIWTGSPLYPLLGFFVDAAAGAVHTGGAVSPIEKRYLLYGEGIFDIITVPLRMFWQGVDGSLRRFDGVLNPVALLFIVLAFVKKPGKTSRYLWYLSAFACAFFALTFFTTDLVIRYLLPLIAPVVIISVVGIKAAVERSTFSRYVALLGLVCFFAFSFVYLYGLHLRYAPIDYLTSGQNRAQYLSQNLPDYKTTAFANANIAKDSKVLFFFTGERTYYWEREYYYGGRYGENLLQYVRGAADGKELFENMQAAGFTHLFIMDAIFERFARDNFNEAEFNILRVFFGNYVKRLYSENGFSLYWIAAKDKPAKAIKN
jgi:hypothetical protein